MTTDPQTPAASSRPPEPTSGGTAPQERAPAEVGVPLAQHKIRRTRAGGVWVAMACFAVVLLLLLIFILQNGRTVGISYLGAHGHLPLGVALLLAAVLGVLMVVLPGTARIIQLRIAARRHRHVDAGHTAATQGADAPGPPPVSA
jgi:lipopolysaccharide assembly protein A